LNFYSITNSSRNKIQVVKKGAITIVKLNRPQQKNAVDRETAEELYKAFQEFDKDINV